MPEGEPYNFEKEIKKISPSSKEYREEREFIKDYNEGTDERVDLFGEYELRKIRFLRDPAFPSTKKLTEQQRVQKIQEVFAYSKKQLASFAHKEREAFEPENSLVFEFFAETAQDEKVKEQMVTLLGNEEGKRHSAVIEDFTDSFVKGKIEIPDDLYKQMLQIHAERVDKSHADLLEHAPLLVKKFKIAFGKGIRSGSLPLTKNLLEQRLSEITFNVKDALQA